MKSNLRIIAPATVTLALSITTSVARAEQSNDAAAAESEPIGEIVVTAQRREQRLQDVPVSVTVTDGASLQRANINTLADLSVRLPNMRLTAAPGANLLYIRGVGSGINSGFEQAVGTFVDGLYRGRSRSSNAGLFDLERIEALKGPQTTFFGNNVIAGALNVVTRKPEHELAYDSSALYAPADGEYAVEGGVSVPFTDTLSARLAGKASGMDGFIYNGTTDQQVPHQQGLLLRASALWEPTDHWRSDLRIDWGRQRNSGEPATEGVDCPPDPIYGGARGTCLRYLNSGASIDDDFDYQLNNAPTRTRYEYVEAGLTNSIDLGSGTLSTSSGYFHHDAQNTTDLAPFPVGGVGGTTTAMSANALEDTTQYSQEVRYTSPQNGMFSYMVGGYYAREQLHAPTYAGFYFAPFGALAAPAYGADTPVAYRLDLNQDTDTWSTFASATFQLTDRFQTDLGLRYSHVSKRVMRHFAYGEGGNVPGPGAFIEGPPAVQAALSAALGGSLGNFPQPHRTDQKLMPSVKLQYELAQDVMTYVSYTKGFKAGGFSATPGRDAFEAENVDAYEIGAKGSFFDRQLFVSLALFLSDYSDLQETTQVPLDSGAIVAVVTNAAAARAQGIELGARYRASSWFSINMDVAYLDAEYRSYPAAPCTILDGLTPNCVQDMSGKKRGFSPEFSGNVGFSLAAPLNDELDIRFDPSVYFTAKYFQSATADALLAQEGYAKLDARLAIGPADQRWEIAVLGKNLTDKKTAAFRQPFAGAPGTIFVYPERRRSVAIQASMKY